jgi:hypothetical protein
MVFCGAPRRDPIEDGRLRTRVNANERQTSLSSVDAHVGERCWTVCDPWGSRGRGFKSRRPDASPQVQPPERCSRESSPGVGCLGGEPNPGPDIRGRRVDARWTHRPHGVRRWWMGTDAGGRAWTRRLLEHAPGGCRHRDRGALSSRPALRPPPWASLRGQTLADESGRAASRGGVGSSGSATTRSRTRAAGRALLWLDACGSGHGLQRQAAVGTPLRQAALRHGDVLVAQGDQHAGHVGGGRSGAEAGDAPGGAQDWAGVGPQVAQGPLAAGGPVQISQAAH